MNRTDEGQRRLGRTNLCFPLGVLGNGLGTRGEDGVQAGLWSVELYPEQGEGSSSGRDRGLP